MHSDLIWSANFDNAHFAHNCTLSAQPIVRGVMDFAQNKCLSTIVLKVCSCAQNKHACSWLLKSDQTRPKADIRTTFCYRKLQFLAHFRDNALTNSFLVHIGAFVETPEIIALY